MSVWAEILHEACWDYCLLNPIYVFNFGIFLKMTSSYDVILAYVCLYDVITDGILLEGLELRNKMALVPCFYLYQNQSYNQKCNFDLCCDPDLDLDRISPENNRPLGFTLRNIHVKYERFTSYSSKVMSKVKVFKMQVKGHSQGHEVKYFCTNGKVWSQGIHM